MWEERCAKGSVCAECKERCHAELANIEAPETVQEAEVPVQGQSTYCHVDDELNDGMPAYVRQETHLRRNDCYKGNTF